MTRDLNLALAGPIAGLTLLAVVGLMGCTSAAGALGSASPTPTATPVLPTGLPTAADPSNGATSDQPLLPVAELVAAQGTILGALGTYVMDGAGSDSPWLPFAAVPVVAAGAADTLQIRFADGAVIGEVSAEFAAADDTEGTHLQAVPGGALATDGSSVTVGPFPAGRWVLEARLFRADGRGDGLTFWAITVR